MKRGNGDQVCGSRALSSIDVSIESAATITSAKQQGSRTQPELIPRPFPAYDNQQSEKLK